MGQSLAGAHLERVVDVRADGTKCFLVSARQHIIAVRQAKLPIALDKMIMKSNTKFGRNTVNGYKDKMFGKNKKSLKTCSRTAKRGLDIPLSTGTMGVGWLR